MNSNTTYQKIASHEAQKGSFDTCLLLYSGGLDTSVMLKWIQEQYGCAVITLTVDIGQTADNLEAIKEKALMLGAKDAIVYDAKDEFADNNNWPHQIYVREARRMIGEYVTTENDVLLKREVPHPVGMGSYAMDSHNVQRYITSEGYVQNEGDIGVSPSAPYSISYGSIVPPKKECANLLVPVCVSSSHIAFGSIRMEPVFMILGQSAAIAACIAIDQKCKIQEVPYQDLRIKLLKEGQILEMPSLKKVE